MTREPTIYRNASTGVCIIVMPGASHSLAWKAVTQ